MKLFVRVVAVCNVDNEVPQLPQNESKLLCVHAPVLSQGQISSGFPSRKCFFFK